MNILFLIGNGFDLNLGMNTRYRDFYKYYESIESSNVLIQKLKVEISKDIENWADLELALGKYTSNLNTADEFEAVFEDIEDKLADYLKEVESNFDYSQMDRKKLLNHLVYPENSLPNADKNELIEFKRKWQKIQWNINILTFNYTRSLEKILDYSEKHLLVNDQIKDLKHQVYIQKIEHIHGYYNERMVMGVNDISQISNKDFHDNQDVLETLIKDHCNHAQKHTIDIWCKSQIPNSNLICIFGSSIGDTDNLWWELIGEQLKNDCKVIIFEKGEIIPTRRPQKGRKAERKKKKYFLDKTNLKDLEKENAEKNIYIGINTDMFGLT
jgi:hypothetical protein